MSSSDDGFTSWQPSDSGAGKGSANVPPAAAPATEGEPFVPFFKGKASDPKPKPKPLPSPAPGPAEPLAPPVFQPSPPPQVDVAAIEKKAYEEGFSRGRKDGAAAARVEAVALTDRLKHLIAEIEGFWPHLVKQHEGQLLRMVFRISEKLVKGQVSIDQTIIRNVILDAFQLIPEPVDVTIRIHPDDYDYIDTIKDDFFEMVNGIKYITVSADASVGLGGCMLETRSGTVDARLESRLAAIERTLMDVAADRGQ